MSSDSSRVEEEEGRARYLVNGDIGENRSDDDDTASDGSEGERKEEEDGYVLLPQDLSGEDEEQELCSNRNRNVNHSELESSSSRQPVVSNMIDIRK